MKDKDHCRLLEIALATVVDAVIGTDAHDCITYFNPAAESMTGWRSNEALGKSLTQVFFLIDQEHDKVIDRPLDGAKDGSPKAAGMNHACVVNRRGLQVGIEYTAVAMRDERGAYAGAVIVSRARRQTAEIALQSTNESLLANADELFEEKERAQVTLNSIGDAVISTNFSGRVSYLNVVAEKMTGWVQLDASGVAVDEIFRLVDATTRETIPCPTAQAIIENRRISLEAVCVLSRRDGEEMAVEVSAAPIHDRNGGVIGAVMVAHDVTAARELSMKLARLALHDSLTELPNRALFSDRLIQATTNARANGGYAALLYVDLDRFKHINDSLGHAIGDQLLQTVARRLLGCVRSTDTVSRQGGDEFVVLLPDIVHVKDAVACAEKLLGALEAPYRIGEHELRISASIGVAIFPDDAREAEALLRCADAAMYQAKYHGRNNYKLFNSAQELDSASELDVLE
ncbi:MAG TPA: diguanylate cyclase [Steroidobacteraceae bacterium]|nr:diguanylate cyclase [Steroidobacteraceae bacterium]